MLIDSHCHLDESTWPDGVDAVLSRAHREGVGGVVAVGVGGLEPARQACALANRRMDVVATVGVHPHEASTFEVVWPDLAPLLREPRVVALGEVGLDFHYDLSLRETQIAVFRRQIQLAKECGKPLVVHSRSAPKETLEILAAEGAREVGGVLHCFSEDRAFAEKAVDLGFYLSFSGILTFPSASSIREAAIWAPIDRILVETDSPYLAPVPLRGKKCEPSYVVHTARMLAKSRGMSFEALVEATTTNLLRVFRLSLDDGQLVPQTAG